MSPRLFRFLRGSLLTGRGFFHDLVLYQAGGDLLLGDAGKFLGMGGNQRP